jgi:hypothetical protein
MRISKRGTCSIESTIAVGLTRTVSGQDGIDQDERPLETVP